MNEGKGESRSQDIKFMASIGLKPNLHVCTRCFLYVAPFREHKVDFEKEDF
jgi:hypothetical protein